MPSSQPPSSPSVDEYYNLGTYRRPITSQHPQAAEWCNLGLLWSYGFNHDEAILCFQRAATLDPFCAMADWGTAYCMGPNYNQPWDSLEDVQRVRKEARAYTESAVQKSASASPVERALIAALRSRYPLHPGKGGQLVWNTNYADDMAHVYRQFSDDLDVATLFADAIMNLNPWHLWNTRTGQPAVGARTLEVKGVLERALATNAHHPGLIHLYIHLMELSPEPERALVAADNLRGLVPDSGHLNHMPSHLDVLCGDYRRAVVSNSQAIVADEKYLARAGAVNFYSLYRAHNYHFRIYAAMFSGQSEAALRTVEKLEASLPEELLRVQMPHKMANWMEGFLGMRVHVLVRFGRWDELIRLELPHDPQLYCVTTAMIHYGKGVAFAAAGHVGAAEAQRELFRQASEKVPLSRTLFNNTCKNILGVASAMLDGEIEYRRGNFSAAFEHLHHAAHLDDNLPYDEPWGWMQPSRHALGALLLEQGRVQEAAGVYRADLGYDATLSRQRQNRNNVWSLHGYHECLLRLGKREVALVVEAQLRLALAVADVPIRASCFCRLKCGEGGTCSSKI